MGQAKLRGSFQDRKSEAIHRYKQIIADGHRLDAEAVAERKKLNENRGQAIQERVDSERMNRINAMVALSEKRKAELGYVRPTPATLVPVVGGRYNWIGQPERLIYMGVMEYRGNSKWHQFAKVEEPGVVWCEVTNDDLSMFEETKEVI